MVTGSATTNSYAFFGQTTFHTTDKLDLTFGLRDTLEAKDGRYQQNGTHDVATGQPRSVPTPLFSPYDSGETTFI
jgi:outer membrane receptor protein involved in Fe transport